MAYESPSFYGTFPASTGLQQYQFVALSTDAELIDPTSAGANVIGVLVSSGTTGSTGIAGSSNSGRYGTVQFYGITKVLAGSTALTGASYISVSALGLAVAGTTNAKVGVVVQDVDSTGGDSTGGIGQQIVSVLLFNSLQ
jgi:hypothetical protein